MKKTTLALIMSTFFLMGGICSIVSVVVENNLWSLFFALANFALYVLSMKVVIDDKD